MEVLRSAVRKDLLGRGNPFQSGKASESLLDAIEQASPSIDRKFAEEPQVAARLHLTIAQALDNRSNFPEAREEYERARKLFVQTGGAFSEDAIAVQLQRAAMEARSFQSEGVATAKSLVADQESMIGKIKAPRKDLLVWLYTAKGMIALIESDAKSANHFFKDASDAASTLPEFDELARFNLRQRLAFTYIRLGDGATAERLARELIAAYSAATGHDSPYVLRVRLNLAQAQGTALSVANCLISRGKFRDASKLLDGIDTKAVAQLTGDPDWGAGVTLAQAEIALGEGNYGEARNYRITPRE